MTAVPTEAVDDLDRRKRGEALFIKVATQNATEGGLSDVVRSAHLIGVQEADKSNILRDTRPNMRWAFWPEGRDHDSLTAIGWDTDVFRAVDPMWHKKFHGSGSGSPDIPDQVKTAARYLTGQPLVIRRWNEPIEMLNTHVIQGYDSDDPDPFKDDRLRLAEHSFDVMRERTARLRDLQRLAFMTADINTVHREIFMTKGWEAVRHSLDRIYWNAYPRVHKGNTVIGPKVGVGSQMRHNSIVTTFSIDPPAKRKP